MEIVDLILEVSNQQEMTYESRDEGASIRRD